MKKAAYYIVLALLIVICGGVAHGAYYYNGEFDRKKKVNTEIENRIAVLEGKIKRASEEVEETEDEIGDTEEEVDDTAIDTTDWVTYTNTKYGFSFKHPASYTTAGCPTKPCGEYIGELIDGDQTAMQGDISVVGWPNINVMHLSSDFYNPPADTDLRTWILSAYSHYGDYISLSPNYYIDTAGGSTLLAFDFTVPASPQSYSQRYIYFVDNDDKLFEISMYDYQSVSSSFYDAWLSSFIY